MCGDRRSGNNDSRTYWRVRILLEVLKTGLWAGWRVLRELLPFISH
jgi:hypothetical protein